MQFLRTANAGGLITLDGVRVLMDGVCGFVAPYLQTPAELREYLQEKVPDAVGFTHLHPDHFHLEYQTFCTQTGAVVLMPGDKQVQVGPISITPINTRHLGKVEEGLIHNSYLISGSKQILFVGDASPLTLQTISNVDILIAPYAYVTTAAGIKAVAATGAKQLILVHLPGVDPDPYGIWDSVREGTKGLHTFEVIIPKMGQEINL